MNNTFILFGLLIFLIYIYLTPKKNKTSEHFKGSSDGVEAIQNIFKKNFDLDYFDTRDPKKMSELKKMFTNKLAPLIQSEMKNNPNKVMSLVKKFTSGIQTNAVPNATAINKTKKRPKTNKTSDYVIPMPNFDSLKGGLLKPLISSFKQIHNLKAQKKVNYKPITDASKLPSSLVKKLHKKEDKEIKKEAKKELFNNNNNKITERNIPDNLKCKFVSSFKSTNMCPVDFPVYTGATVSGLGSSLSCNNKNVSGKRSTALAIIRNGEVDKIKLVKKGSHYSKVPRVYIRGIGSGAKATAKIVKGSVVSITVVNKGTGYNSTPTVIIEKPQVNIHCNLCCKK